MKVFVLYYCPRGSIAEDVEIVGVFSTRFAAERRFDDEVVDRGCASHEMRIAVHMMEV